MNAAKPAEGRPWPIDVKLQTSGSEIDSAVVWNPAIVMAPLSDTAFSRSAANPIGRPGLSRGATPALGARPSISNQVEAGAFGSAIGFGHPGGPSQSVDIDDPFRHDLAHDPE